MSSSEHSLILSLTKAFKAAADPSNAVFQKAYMRDQFAFFGLKTETRRKITKDHFRKIPIKDHQELETVIKSLWNLPQREYQYGAQELLVYHRKIWTPKTIKLIEFCITHKSWWDTVDYLSSYGSGGFFRDYPGLTEKVTGQWNRSDNIWLNRSSLLFQLKYKTDTDTALLADYIKRLASSREFFIQKSIGWVLREYSKTDPAWVKRFIKENQLAALSVKEGSKYL